MRSRKQLNLIKELGLLVKDVSETIKNKVEGQKPGFLGMLLGTSAGSLLGDRLVKKTNKRW